MARLIIVEDNRELATLVASAARARGHQIVVASTGQAALAALGGAPFDVALVDLLLPDTRGAAVLEALRARHVPAVAMSGVYKGEKFAREAIEKHGAQQFFEKPFDIRALLEAIESVAASAPLAAEIIEDEEEEEEEVVLGEELIPLEDDEVDEPLSATPSPPPLAQASASQEEMPEFVVAAPPLLPVELDEEPNTPTRPLDRAELAALAQSFAAEAAADDGADEDDQDEIPTRVGPPPAFDAPLPELELELEEALEALEPLESLAELEPPPIEAAEPVSVEAVEPTPEAVEPPPVAETAPAEPVEISEPPPAAEAPLEPVELSEPPPAAEAAPLEPVEPSEPLPSVEVSEAASLEPAEVLEPPPPGTASPPAEPSPPAPAPDDVVLPFAERGRVWEKPDHPGRKRPLPDWSEAGDLSRTSVPRLLNAFHESRHSGELKLKQDSIIKVIHLDAGRPVFAASNLASERFGRFCVRRGAAAEADLERVTAFCESEKLRTAEAMIRLGLLTQEKRLALLEEQVREIIWSTFGWTRGQYSLTSGPPARPDLVKLQISPGELILQGVHRTDTLLSLRRKMPPNRRLFPTPDPPYLAQDLPLGQPQAMLLAAADGSKTVEDLLALTDLSEREALAALAGFELLGLLEERREEPKRQRISFGL